MNILDRLRAQFSPERISNYLVDRLVPGLVVALITVAAFFVLWRFVRRALAILDVDSHELGTPRG